MPHTAAARRWRMIAVFVGVICAVALLMVGLLYRAHRTDITAKQLCHTIAAIVIEQDARLDSVAYYKRHPAELARAHVGNRRVLARLNCSDLPPLRRH